METCRITAPEARALLEKIKTVRIAFLGDMFLDAYWHADMRRSVLSNETPHHPLPVTRECYSPGGGANVAANLAALGPGQLKICSVWGDDWRGMLLRWEMERLPVDLSGVFAGEGWITNAYCKPMRHGVSDVVYEDPRIDFENGVPLPEAAENRLLMILEGLAGQVDAVAVTDQCRFGILTPRVREAVQALGRKMPVVADSRDSANLYGGVIVKPNEHEAARLFGVDTGSLSACLDAVRQISQKTGAPALITLGEQGAVGFDGAEIFHAPAFPRKPPLDIVGAGDTFLSAVTAALAAGAALPLAASLGNAASAVTVKKCGMTGTASPEEILAVLQEDAWK